MLALFIYYKLNGIGILPVVKNVEEAAGNLVRMGGQTLLVVVQ